MRDRLVTTLSGGEQKRLALEVLLRGHEEVLLLDEPDNYLDVAGQATAREGAAQRRARPSCTSATTASCSPRPPTRIVTLEGHGVWVHGGGFADYAEARAARLGRLDELHRRWDEEHEHLKDLVRRMRVQATMSDAMASRLQAAVTRLRRFEEAGPPAERPRRQDVRIRLRGGRTGLRVLTCHKLAIPGLVLPFDLEVSFGERIALLGNNGTGKSHLLRLFAGEDIAHEGRFALGARVNPGHFKQTHEHPELRGRTLVESLHQHGLEDKCRSDACA